MHSLGQTETQRRMELAAKVARLGGKATLAPFELAQAGALRVEQKPDGTPVTPGDRDAESAMRDLLTRESPDDGILGEEFGEKPGTSGIRWVLDPIDGTKSFLRGVPLYGTLAAAEYDGVVVAAAMEFAPLDERIWAGKGLGAWWQRGNAEPIRAHVSQKQTISESCACFTEMSMWNDELSPTFKRVTGSFKIVRGWSDCYADLLLATGRVEAVIEPEVSIWDVAAPTLIIEEAGGAAGDWTGQGDHTSTPWIGTNRAIHAELVELLANAG